MGSNDEVRYGASHIQGQLHNLISPNQENFKVMILPPPIITRSVELTTPKNSQVQNFAYKRELPVLKIVILEGAQ